jgi:hypothetical protein
MRTNVYFSLLLQIATRALPKKRRRSTRRSLRRSEKRTEFCLMQKSVNDTMPDMTSKTSKEGPDTQDTEEQTSIRIR